MTIARNTTGNVSLTINKIITAQVNVKDGAGNNVGWAASVRVTGNGVDQSKKTDGSGNVTFSLPAGEYLFTATCNEYKDDSKNILISDESNSVNLTIVHKVGSITVIVKDNKGQPISGAEISESYSNPKKVLGTTDTNEKVIVLTSLPGKAQATVKSGAIILKGAKVTMEGGESKNTNLAYGWARFENITSGEVNFSASMPGYASKTVTATIAPGNASSDPYTLVEINLIALDPATLVTLTVNSNYDPALNNVVLFLRDSAGFEIAASSKVGSQLIFSGLAPNSSYTIIGKYNGVYNSVFDQGVNMGLIDRTVAYNKFS